jgi:hypothetical protein
MLKLSNRAPDAGEEPNGKDQTYMPKKSNRFPVQDITNTCDCASKVRDLQQEG